MTNDPWTWDWTAVAAIGTAAAALLSVFAIIVAAFAARASARAATAAERQLAAQTTPVVVEVPRSGYLQQEEKVRFPDGLEISSPVEGQVLFSAPEGDMARCSIPVQNIGTGIAQVTRAYLDFHTTTVEFLQAPDDEDDPQAGTPFIVVSRGLPTHIWLPPGGHARLATTVSEEDEVAWNAMRDVTSQPQNFVQVRILFSDATGTQSFKTLLHLRQAPHEVNSWRVYQQWTRPASGEKS